MFRWLACALLAAPLLAQQCSYTVAPLNVSVPAGEVIQTFQVSSTPGCIWTARSNVSWIIVTFGQTGAGNGSVSVRITANREAASRSGSLTIAGQTVSVTQAGANCNLTLNPQSRILTAAGGGGSFQVTTTCNWRAEPSANWIEIRSPPGGNGFGSGAVAYFVQPNMGAARTGTIQVGPLRFTIEQPAGSCTQTLNPTETTIPASGGNGTIQVTSNCIWTAAPVAVTWITIVSGASGDGNGLLTYSVLPNMLRQPRTGSIRVGDKMFRVTQAGEACAVTLTQSSANVAAAGGSGTIVVSSQCDWSAIPSEPWITVIQTAASVTYRVEANTDGVPRTGTIEIGDQTFTITQEAGSCPVMISPSSAQVAAGGGAGSFLVSSDAACLWVITAVPAWVTMTPMSGRGGGTVIYSISPNLGTSRTAVVRVNTQAFTISQDGVRPSLTAAGVLNAASFEGESVAPGLILTIFGIGLGPSELTVATVDQVSRTYPTVLAGTRVLFDGVAAPMLYVSGTQIGTITPFGVAGRPLTQVEIEVGAERTRAVFIPVAPTAPGIFTQSAQGQGAGAILNQDFTINTPENGAAPGSFIIVFATGGGVVQPPAIDGTLTEGLSATVAPVAAEIGGRAAEVAYAGGAPGLVAGVLQVNARVPERLEMGQHEVLIRVGESVSQRRVFISVR